MGFSCISVNKKSKDKNQKSIAFTQKEMDDINKEIPYSSMVAKAKPQKEMGNEFQMKEVPEIEVSSGFDYDQHFRRMYEQKYLKEYCNNKPQL